ncbi:MAG: right-handed parallel beta-helix repeat-containing protein [Thermoplasmatota archaeon]
MRTRGRLTVVVAALAMIIAAFTLPAGANPSPPPCSKATHGTINIQSYSDFTAANGVVSGAGTDANPFVIQCIHVEASGTTPLTISVKNRSYILRWNDFYVDPGSATTAVVLSNAQGRVVLEDNVIHSDGTALSITSMDPFIANNSFSSSSSTQGVGTGIDAKSSSAHVFQNHFVNHVTGITWDKGAPHIEGNELDETTNGIKLDHDTVGTHVEGNVIAHIRGGIGIRIDSSQDFNISKNLVEHASEGIHIQWCGPGVVFNNTVTSTTSVGLMSESCNATISFNLFTQGVAGIQLWQSDSVVINNTIEAFSAIAVEWKMSEGVTAGNRISACGWGILLQDTEKVVITDNVLVNNTFGLDIPYIARANILWMHGNFVNGINVDGSVNAQQKSYFYEATNVAITGVTLDSGFAAHFYGSVSANGGITIYDSDTINITASLVSHNRVGIHIVNSFNIAVRASVVASNTIGVQVENVTVPNMGHVPPCVAFVKNTTITIPTDPAGTIGVKVTGPCHMLVLNSTIQFVETGISFDVNTDGVIAGNLVTHVSGEGVHVEGGTNEAHDRVVIDDNRVLSNHIGVRLIGSGASLDRNRVIANGAEGVRVEGNAHPLAIANNVSLNAGGGIIDAGKCGNTPDCSRGELRANTLVDNKGNGIKLLKGSTLIGNTILGSDDTQIVLGGNVDFENNLVKGGRQDGGSITGAALVAGSTFIDNGGSGLLLAGNAGLRDSVFDDNVDAGLLLATQFVNAFHIDASHNLDGIRVQEDTSPPPLDTLPGFPINPANIPLGGSVPNPTALIGGGSGSPFNGPDPLYLHRSTLVGNERDAVRAGVALVNATYDYWGTPNGPTLDTGVTGPFADGVTPYVIFIPYYTDASMTTTGPIDGL